MTCVCACVWYVCVCACVIGESCIQVRHTARYTKAHPRWQIPQNKKTGAETRAKCVLNIEHVFHIEDVLYIQLTLTNSRKTGTETRAKEKAIRPFMLGACCGLVPRLV